MKGRRRKLRAVSVSAVTRTSYDLRTEYIGGQPKHSAPIEVDNPHNPNQKTVVFRLIRDDPLAGMHARGQIDEALLAAGRAWQRHHEASEVGSISAIDPAREAVDGGRIREPITDRQIQSFKQLAKAKQLLGDYGHSVVYEVLAQRRCLKEVAERRGMTREIEVNYIGRRFRECLESLAVLWGFAKQGT